MAQNKNNIALLRFKRDTSQAAVFEYAVCASVQKALGRQDVRIVRLFFRSDPLSRLKPDRIRDYIHTVDDPGVRYLIAAEASLRT